MALTIRATTARGSSPERINRLDKNYLAQKYKLEEIEQLEELKEIEIANAVVRSLDAQAFHGLPKLEFLILHSCQLGRTRIGPRLFLGLSNLRGLQLSYDYLDEIDPDAFKDLTKLEFLVLRSNPLGKVDSRWFQSGENLKMLDLRWAKLESIEEQALSSNLGNLRELRLSSNSLVEIDATVFENLSNLVILKLENNQLDRIHPDAFKVLRKLAILDLSNNKLTELDARLLENTSNLRELNLKSNQLQSIDPGTFVNTIQLELLNLSSNKLTQLEAGLFENTKSLEKLFLSANRLRQIDSNAFGSESAVRFLTLNSNQIEELDARLWSKVTNLQELWLDHNNIEKIGARVFESLANLVVLSLGYNSIVELDEDAFENLRNLKTLWLDHNKLRKVFQNHFEPLDSIELIGIFDNEPDLGARSFYRSFHEPTALDDSHFDYFRKGLALDLKAQSHEDLNEFLLQFDKLEDIIPDPYIGKRFQNRYVVTERLGKGAFGKVYLVFDENLEAKKAMKVMPRDVMSLNEQKLLWQVNHQNVLRYFDHFALRASSDDLTCVITEYCADGSLEKKIEEAQSSGQNFPNEIIFDWMFQACNGLQYLHYTETIIHRDIKPENILLTKKNVLKLADLGLSIMMEKSHISRCAGSQPYMSPEIKQAVYKKVKIYPNTDVWSLGCVLFDLVFLERAFPRGKIEERPFKRINQYFGPFKTMLLRMIEISNEKRITSKELFVALLPRVENIQVSIQFD